MDSQDTQEPEACPVSKVRPVLWDAKVLKGTLEIEESEDLQFEDPKEHLELLVLQVNLAAQRTAPMVATAFGAREDLLECPVCLALQAPPVPTDTASRHSVS